MLVVGTTYKGYYCGCLGMSSGHPSDGRRSRAGGTCPIAYSLHDPRGLASSRIRLSPQSILFIQSCLIAPYLQSPLYFLLVKA